MANSFYIYVCFDVMNKSASYFVLSRIPYPQFVGGVLAMTSGQFIAVNGFSNFYFGWGGEDDDMYKR